MNEPLRLGLIGFGKIARDEHVPAIRRTPGAELVAVASRNAVAQDVANYRDLAALLAGEPNVDAIILCQPPQFRYESARIALLAGKHVFLEKPPGATLSEVEALAELARVQGVSLFASWHSRWSASVADFKRWCRARSLQRVTVTWKEDVRRWHPAQAWIWDAGGFGVFDPGINALSILTEVLPERLRLIAARLEFPANRQAPIGVEMAMQTAGGIPVTACFDWRQTGPQTWEIMAESDAGSYRFFQGGNDAASSQTDGESTLAPEYRAMYSHFVNLVRAARIEVDLAPLQLVADAFMRGQILLVAPFEDDG